MRLRPLESAEYAYTDLLPFGAEIEVITPPELRERMAAIVEAMTRVYRASASSGDLHRAGVPREV